MPRIDINIVQSAIFTLNAVITDANGAPVNLTNYSGSATFRQNAGDANYLQAFGVNLSGSTAILTLTPTQTTALPVTQGVYDLDLYDPNSVPNKVLWGYGNVYPFTGPISSSGYYVSGNYIPPGTGSYVTNADLLAASGALQSQIAISNAGVTSINGLSGIVILSGQSGIGISKTGQNIIFSYTGAGGTVTGNYLPFNSGAYLQSNIDNLSGYSNLTFATINNLGITGGNLYNLITGLSGNLNLSGNNNYNLIVGLSGVLIGTGNNLLNQINNLNNSFSANLISTGVNLNSNISNLNNILNTFSGSIYSGFINFVNTTGHQEVTGIKSFHSGIKVFNNIAGAEYLTIFSSGNSGLLKDAGGGNNFTSIDWINRKAYTNSALGVVSIDWSNLILSGNWTTNTAPTISNHLINLGYLTTVSGIIVNQIGGSSSGSQVQVTGSNNLPIANLSGAGSIAVYSTPAFVVISGTAAGGGEINTASNLGFGSGLFSQKVGVDLQFKSLSVDSNFTLTGSANQLGLNFVGSYLPLSQTGQFGSSGNLTATGIALINLINGLSGSLVSTGNGLQSQINTISSNLQTTGSNLQNNINSLSGYSNNNFATISNLQITGSVLYNYITGLSGQFNLTGNNLQNSINSLSGYSNNNFATINNLFNTGSNLSNQIIGLSGALNATGSNNYNLINSVSSNLQTTGSNLINIINGNYNNTLQLTGAATQLVQGMKEFHSGFRIFNSNGGQEYLVLSITGSSGVLYDSVGAPNHISIDFFNRSLYDSSSNKTLDYNLKALTGNWGTNTVPTVGTNLINLSFVSGISGVLQSQINNSLTNSNFVTGITISGSNSITGFVGFTGINGVNVLNSGNSVILNYTGNPNTFGQISANSFIYFDAAAQATRLIIETQNTTSFGSSFRGKKARGPSQNLYSGILKDDNFLQVVGDGYSSGSGYISGRVSMSFHAAEDWTGANGGTYLTLRTTPTGGATNGFISSLERIRITSEGNIGINNSNPLYTLHVSGNANFSSGLFISGNPVSTGAGGGSGPTFTWQQVTGDTNISFLNGYICSGGTGLINLILPTTAAIGNYFRATTVTASGFKIVQNSGQVIYFGNTNTLTGVSGFIQNTINRDSIEILCANTNTDFQVISSIGNFIVN